MTQTLDLETLHSALAAPGVNKYTDIMCVIWTFNYKQHWCISDPPDQLRMSHRPTNGEMRAEPPHHFGSLLDTEIGLVSFDLQSRSGCCPLTAAYGEMKKDVAVILRVSLFWHVIHGWMGGLSKDEKKKYLNKWHICWGKVQPALELPPLSELASLMACICTGCFLGGRGAYGGS